MESLNIRQIKTKKPWGRITPKFNPFPRSFTMDSQLDMPEESPAFHMVTQADFLRELHPSGHKIFSPEYYPDIWRKETVAVVDENGNPTGQTQENTYCEPLPRYAFAFQQIIMYKQLTHLCGNDIQFDHTSKTASKSEEDLLDSFREGWLSKDQEIAFYESCKSVKGTGDTAYVGYISKGKYGWQVFSALKGDVLYPHFNHDGSLALFARSFSDYDENGSKIANWLEVWDETYLYRYRQSTEEDGSIISRIKSVFGLSGYKLIEKAPHGFPFIPVAYKRDENGACWSDSQNSIECYELSFSQMAHNNQLYGEPTMYLQGDNVEAIHDMNGTLRMLTLGAEDKAGYLESQSAADSYQKQLELNYKMIYEQSFAVIPPQISGNSDISGAAIKILYSPAVEKAMADANEYQSFLNDMVRIFAYGYGVECKRSIDFSNLALKSWIRPFVFTNEYSMVNDLVQAVSAGFCSKDTAANRIQFYTEACEMDKIIREQKQEQQADLLFQLKQQQNSEPTNQVDNTNNK